MSQELYDRLADEELAKRNAAGAAAMRGVASMHPDKTATVVRLARETGLPPEVAERNQEAAQQMRMAREVADLASRSPILARQLGDKQFAAMAQDDIATLGGVEQGIGGLVSYAMGARPDGGLPTQVARGVRSLLSGMGPTLGAGAYGAAAYPLEALGLEHAGGFMRDLQRQSRAVAERFEGLDPDAGIFERGIMSGLRSSGQTLATLPAGFTQGAQVAGRVLLTGQEAVLGAMGGLTFGQTYGKAREAGLGVGQAGMYGLQDATAEIVTEKLFGVVGLMKDAKAGLGATRIFMRDIAREVPGEMGATLWQNFNEWGNVNPDKSVGDWLAEQPAALAETIIATIVGAGAQTGAVRGVQKALGDVARREADGREATASAERLQALTTIAEASKLKGRDAETFRDLVATIADEEGDAPTELYIAGEDLTRVLNQSGISRAELAAIAPVVAEQMEAAAAGAMVRVPVSEFLTAGEQVTSPLIDFMRTGPEAMSRAEAVVAVDEETAQMQAAMERELGSVEKASQFRDSVAGLASQFEAGLVAAGRRQSVAKAEASLVANYYGTQAARSGVTLEEFAQRYRLGFARGGAAGARTLAQPEFAVAGAQVDGRTVRADIPNRSSIDASIDNPKVLPGVREVPISAFDPEYVAGVSARKLDARTQKLADEIAASGEINPLIVAIDAQGPYILEGGHRFDALIKSGAKSIPALVVIDQDAAGTLNQSRIDQTQTAAFKRWFGDSKVVDAQGKPLVVYHGTQDGDFDTFAPSKRSKEPGIFFSPNPEIASAYTGFDPEGNFHASKIGNVLPVYLKLENPLVVDLGGSKTGRAEAFAKAIAGGHDGILLKNHYDAGGVQDQWVAFRPEQIKSAIGNRGTFDPNDPSILNQSAHQRTAAFRAWSGDAPFVSSEAAKTHEFKSGEPVVAEAYHGTKRPDRVGTKFLKKRATSGPMAFFTSSPELASGYAAGKGDTSLINEDTDYANWFKVKLPGERSKRDIVRAWYGLTADQKDRISALAPRVMFTEDATAPVLGPEDHKSGTGSYDYNLDATKTSWDRRGNPMKALVEDWLNSGNLINDEEAFTQVLKLAGFPMEVVEFDSPNAEFPFVYKVYVAMRNPLATNDVPQPVVDALAAAAKRDRSRAQQGGADMWDKNTRTLRDWVKAFGGESGEYAWTSIPDKVTDVLRGLGYDGIIDKSGKGGGPIVEPVYIPFEETQVKSAIGNKGTYRGDKNDILKQGGARAQISLPPSFDVGPAVIRLLEGADLSSVIHESGHLFLEIEADLAARIQQQISAGASVSASERAIVEDMGKLLAWFGIKDSPEQSALDTWAGMTLEEKREHHETFARGFEAYTREGKAPSVELEGLFSRFRSWMLEVYKKLRGLDVTLTDDVRGVMDRMLASDEAIAEAQASRAMGPLFRTAEQAGMTVEQYEAMQAQGAQATASATSALDARSLADMKWMSRARDKAMKARQDDVEGIRREMRMRAREAIYSLPVYQAWQFLTGKPLPGDEVADGKQEKAESLLGAIARHGGLSQASARADLGVAKDDSKGGLRSAFRAAGGLDADTMAERLLEDGYLTADENGKHSLQEFEDRLAAEIRGDPQYAMGHDFALTEEGRPAEPLPGEVRFGKLSTPMLRDQYGTGEQALWRKLSARRMTSETGIDPEVVAATFEFDSGDALVQSLAKAVPPLEVIEARTDARMLEEHGDITSPAALAQAADEAVFNEARARFVAAELKALRDAGKATEGKKTTAAVLAKAAKGYAQQIVARLRIRDLRPSAYAAASARSGRLAEKALGADKLDEAAMHKRNQLVNTYAAKAAYEAQAEVAKARAYFDRVARSKGVDQEYLDQIDQLLEGFDFKAPTLKESKRRASLSEWIAEQEAQMIPVAISPELLATAGRKQYRDMTMEELRGLVDAIKQIEHVGRLKKRLLNARDQRELEAIAEEMKASIVKHGGEALPQEYEEKKGLSTWAADFWASHRKMSSLARQIDGNIDSGPMWTHFVRGMNEHVDAEVVANTKAAEALDRMYAPLYKLRGGLTGARSKVKIDAINASLTRAARMSVALNWGNEDNRQRLLSTGIGGPWSEAQVRAIMSTLSAQELGVVNDIWAYLDTYWPDVSDLQKRITGTAPEKVEAAPFVVMSADGVEVPMRGGYYPIKYNHERSGKAEQRENAQIAKDAKRGAFGKAMTRHGHTEARQAEVKEPLSLDLSVVTRHLHEVIHDLSWREWLIDSNKIIGEVGETIAAHYGRSVLRQFNDGIEQIAVGDLSAQTAVERGALMLRANVSRATMGLSFTTAFLQPFGLTQSVVRIGNGNPLIGMKYVLRGAMRWAGDASHMQSSLTQISEKSSFMRHRSETFNRELREISARVDGQSKAAEMRDAILFYVMKKAQLIADVPTWLGQYEKTMDEGPKEDTEEGRTELEARAVAMADRVVREAQGSGHDADLAQIQRKTVVGKLLTQFYSYFNVTLNLAIEQTAATDFKSPSAVVAWVGDMALLAVVPAILPAMLMYALKGGEDDDDWLKRLAKWQGGYLLGLVVGVRELSGMLEGYDYSGPPAARPFVHIGKAWKQTMQGDIDEPLIKAYANAIGTLLGLPMAQAMRSWNGYKAWAEGKEGAGPQSLLFGPPPKN